jgi:hypothetical protein
MQLGLKAKENPKVIQMENNGKTSRRPKDA